MSSQDTTGLKKPQLGELGENTPLLPAPSQQERPSEPTELHGYLLMAGSCIGFAIMSLQVHIAENKLNFPATSSLFIRAVVQATLAFTYIIRYLPFPETFTNLTRKQVKLLAFRGVAGSLAIALYLATLKRLPVGDGVTLFFSTPVITLILSGLVLGEQIKMIDGAAAAISFTGIVLIARPDFSLTSDIAPHDRILGGIYGIVGAVLSSIVYVIVRSLGTSIHFMVSVFALGFVAIFTATALGGALGPVAFWNMKEGALLIVISSLFAFSAQCCVNRGLQLCPSGPGVLLRNLDVPLAYILGLMFLNESPSLLSFIGSMFVLLSAVMVGLRKMMWS